MNQDRFEKAFTEGGKTVVEGLNTMQELFDRVHAEFVGAKAEQLRLQKELADAKAEKAYFRRGEESSECLRFNIETKFLDMKKELEKAEAENAKLKAELKEIRTQRDCYAKDFFRLKRIVDGDYKGTIDTTCSCEKKRNAESANEDPAVKHFQAFLREFWGTNR